ncbi:hypothetical protein PTSG_04384 [Salpingoeca rosetta]|uniref:Steroid 5-alpha reductase C-terminal domain-containing protein n=1 Tax=Salpingoeca rosetta (strain ATCC 50818 / BSB-021) TaxID=946362 RepID=F2U8E1_SALR5|nr:uncharacterized protein PTSG_04384 [Salpingoeca rosetta]EGD72649.1 hypothetical protein PTSG_04384 [Salpingoeca rosetta]|eukprot:XP_004994472.1 hypothetical protein PTSG_04384 [Salpingoeca rosetta]
MNALVEQVLEMEVVGSEVKAAALNHAVEAHRAALPLLCSIYNTITDVDGLVDLYWNSDAMAVAVVGFMASALFCIIAGPLTGDYSWVDRMWSLWPGLYTWHFAVRSDYDSRLVIMASLATLWSVRLTYNFARKGGYKLGHEDYRWPELRKRMPPLAFQVFNVFFISIFQHYLLLMFVSSSYVAYLGRGTDLTLVDMAAAVLFFVFFLIETISDEQQWAFQTRKHAMQPQERTGDFARGFLTRGLFRYSRHPNFFAEQCLWWSFYLFAVGVSGQVLGWAVVGPLVLSLLFQGSTQFTEELSLAKYPAYARYQQTTSRLIPCAPGPDMDSIDEDKKTQ